MMAGWLRFLIFHSFINKQNCKKSPRQVCVATTKKSRTFLRRKIENAPGTRPRLTDGELACPQTPGLHGWMTPCFMIFKGMAESETGYDPRG